MKKFFISVLVISFAFCVFTAVLTAEEQMPPAEAQALWTYITETNSYTDWKMWPGKEGMYPGTSPHGAFLKVYVNEEAYQAAKEGKPMPNGAIIVKENYGEDKEKLMALTPMYKVEGYNPDAGDWFWAKYGGGDPPTGEVMAAGKVEGCINCHKTQENFLFTDKE